MIDAPARSFVSHLPRWRWVRAALFAVNGACLALMPGCGCGTPHVPATEAVIKEARASRAAVAPARQQPRKQAH